MDTHRLWKPLEAALNDVNDVLRSRRHHEARRSALNTSLQKSGGRHAAGSLYTDCNDNDEVDANSMMTTTLPGQLEGYASSREHEQRAWSEAEGDDGVSRGEPEAATNSSFGQEKSSKSAAAVRGVTRTAPAVASCLSKMQWYTHIFNGTAENPDAARWLHKRLAAWVRLDLNTNVAPTIAALVANCEHHHHGSSAGRGGNDRKHLSSPHVFEEEEDVFSSHQGGGRTGHQGSQFEFTNFIESVTAVYDDFRILTRFACTVFSYLDKTFERKPGFNSVRTIFLLEFHRQFYNDVKGPLLKAVNGLLAEARRKSSGDVFGSGAAGYSSIPPASMYQLQLAVDFFVSIGTINCCGAQEKATIFTEDFEDGYVEAVSEQLSELAHQVYASVGGNTQEYFKWCEGRLAFEEFAVWSQFDDCPIYPIASKKTSGDSGGTGSSSSPVAGDESDDDDGTTTTTGTVVSISSTVRRRIAIKARRDRTKRNRILEVAQKALLRCLFPKQRCIELLTNKQFGVVHLLKQERYDSLKRIYNILNKIPRQDGVQLFAIEVSVFYSIHVYEEINKRYAEGIYQLSGAAGGGGGGGRSASASCFSSSSPTPAASASPLPPQSVTTVSLQRSFIEEYVEELTKKAWMIRDVFQNNALIQESDASAMSYQLNRQLFDVSCVNAAKKPVGAPSHAHHQVRRGMANASELLADYVDAMMRGELKNLATPEEEDDRLDQLCKIFYVFKEKDVFQALHRSRLAKRLLTTTPNEDLERLFLSKLQKLQGKSFTHKMEGMMKDREAATTVAQQFEDAQRGVLGEEDDDDAEKSDKKKATNVSDAATAREGDETSVLPYKTPSHIKFTPQVLTAGHWPPYRTEDAINLHRDLSACIAAFTRFYMKTHTNRNLSWIHVLGSMSLGVKFPKGTKEVSCNIYQGTILLLVDEHGGGLAVKAIAESLGVDLQRVVKPHIATMYLSKAFPLLCLEGEEGPTTRKSIDDEDFLVLNRAFSHKMRRFKLGAAPSVAKSAPAAVNSNGKKRGSSGGGGGDDEQAAFEAELQAKRRTQMDAAIVRVLKSRRSLPFNEMIPLVQRQLEKLFPADVKLLKLRVEDLIERGFLQRSEADSTVLEYLA